jgi:hypothetical protein
MNIGEGISGAVFSSSHEFRYALWRIWQQNGAMLLYIGLNPSTANNIKDDPTIRRMVGFAKAWGYGGLYVGNLFSFVSSDPKLLHGQLGGGATDTALKKMRQLSSTVLVGWGNWGHQAGTRPTEVLAIVGDPVYCLKVTKMGEPSHPLYFCQNSKFIEYVRQEFPK